MVGVKNDSGKLEWDLLPIEPVEEIIRVLMYGKQKYSKDNWKKVPESKTRYYNALMRHITAWQKGEKFDPETKLSHLSHAGCCLLFLLHEEVNEII